MIKALVPRMHTNVVDRAIQVYGAMGLTPDTPLADMWTGGCAALRRRAGSGASAQHREDGDQGQRDHPRRDRGLPYPARPTLSETPAPPHDRSIARAH